MKAKASRTLQLQWEKPRKGVSIFEDAVLERMSRGAVDPLSPGSVWDTDSNSPPPQGLLAWFTKPETVVREEPSSDKGRRKGSAVMDERECLKVGVIMQRLKKFKSTGEMKEALVTCDESRLTADDLDVLAVNFPAKAACEKVRKLAGESMGPYDQFVSMLDSIPKLRERLECMMFVQRFDSVASDVEARVQNLRKALDFLCSSAELQTILQTFRRVGNALNEGTRVGNFDAFALNNAATTLANCVSPIDKRVTLRSYAVSLIPEVVARFTEEATVALARVKSGGAESTMELIRDVVLSFENIRTREVATRRRTVCPAEFDPMDTFSERMETFAEEHEERVHSLATAAMRWGQDYVQALVFFGDAGNFWPSMKSEGDKCAPDFFHCMLSLAAELKKDLQAIGPVSVEPKTPIRPNRTPRRRCPRRRRLRFKKRRVRKPHFRKRCSKKQRIRKQPRMFLVRYPCRSEPRSSYPHPWCRGRKTGEVSRRKCLRRTRIPSSQRTTRRTLRAPPRAASGSCRCRALRTASTTRSSRRGLRGGSPSAACSITTAVCLSSTTKLPTFWPLSESVLSCRLSR
jgi:hypothetical protein